MHCASFILLIKSGTFLAVTSMQDALSCSCSQRTWIDSVTVASWNFDESSVAAYVEMHLH